MLAELVLVGVGVGFGSLEGFLRAGLVSGFHDFGPVVWCVRVLIGLGKYMGSFGQVGSSRQGLLWGPAGCGFGPRFFSFFLFY